MSELQIPIAKGGKGFDGSGHGFFGGVNGLVVDKFSFEIGRRLTVQGHISLRNIVRVKMGARLHLPGTTPHLVNRLDRETSGVVVIAKNGDFFKGC